MEKPTSIPVKKKFVPFFPVTEYKFLFYNNYHHLIFYYPNKTIQNQYNSQ